MEAYVSVITAQVGTHVAVALLQRAATLAASFTAPHTQAGGVDLSKVNARLEKLDVEAKLTCLATLVAAIDENLCSKPVRVALISLTTSVHEVDESLQLLRNAVEYHQSRFFSAWRSCDFTEPLLLLDAAAAKMVQRESTLLKMIAIDFSKLQAPVSGPRPACTSGLNLASSDI